MIRTTIIICLLATPAPNASRTYCEVLVSRDFGEDAYVCLCPTFASCVLDACSLVYTRVGTIYLPLLYHVYFAAVSALSYNLIVPTSIQRIQKKKAFVCPCAILYIIIIISCISYRRKESAETHAGRRSGV